MPVYEYFCTACDGVFETLRSIREASEPAPCPQCDGDARRIMPTSFSAFTFREGYPRRLPDRGTYWHLGKEVKQRIRGKVKPFHHPEIDRPEPPKRKSKGDAEVEQEKARLRGKERRKMLDSGVQPTKRRLPRSLQK